MSDVLSPTGDIPAIRPQTQMAKGDFHFRISEFGKLISLRSVGSDFAYPEASPLQRRLRRDASGRVKWEQNSALCTPSLGTAFPRNGDKAGRVLVNI